MLYLAGVTACKSTQTVTGLDALSCGCDSMMGREGVVRGMEESRRGGVMSNGML